jgi:type II secretory pathway pseudopilin PulG
MRSIWPTTDPVRPPLAGPKESCAQRSALTTQRPCRAARAFSLIEVVAAVGIFAIGMVAVIGLFTPIAKSVGSLKDAEAATNVAALLATHLQGQTISKVGKLLKVKGPSGLTHQLTDIDNAPNSAAADPRGDPAVTQLLFASRDGAKIGDYRSAVWSTTNDAEKFFEIALIRNEALSPPATVTDSDGVSTPTNSDETALFLAYTARVRWPAFVPDSTPTNRLRALPAGFSPAGGVRFDNSQKQVLFFSGTITR